MSGVFVSYRKGPHSLSVEALREQLAGHFGADQVFLDKVSMDAGDRYPDTLREGVAECDVLLVVIDDGWLTAAESSGVRLLDRPRDWVREEIEFALRAGKVVVPLLLAGARAPVAAELPGSIADLAHRQARVVQMGRFAQDVRRLIEELEPFVAPRWEPAAPDEPGGRVLWRWWRRSVWLLAALLFAAPVVVELVISGPEPPDDLIDAFVSVNVVTVYLMAPMVGAIGGYLMRRRAHRLERELSEVPPTRYNATIAVPLTMLIAVFAMAGTMAADEHWRERFPITMALIGIGVWRGVLLGMRIERGYDKDERDWPGPLPARASRQAVRDATNRLLRRLASWKHPLTRQQREQARWAIDHLATVADDLRMRAARPRRTWLATDGRWWWLYLVIAAGILGLPVSIVGHAVVHGYVTAGYYRLLAMSLTLGLVPCAVALEFAYRLQRWNWTMMASDTDSMLDTARERLGQLESGGEPRS